MGDIQKAEYYDNIYLGRNSYKVNYKKSEYYKLWLEVLKEISDFFILEIGCGTGQFAHLLWDNGFREYVGADFSVKAIKIANKLRKKKEMNSFSFLKHDILDPQLYKMKIETVIALEVFEHIDDHAVINNIKNGIRVIFTLPVFDDPAHVRFFKTIKEVRDRYGKHFEEFEARSFDKYFICAGIKK